VEDDAMNALHAFVIMVQATGLQPSDCWHVGMDTLQGRVVWSGPAHSATQAEVRARRLMHELDITTVFVVEKSEHPEECGE
jgi:hypothetical protein